MKTKNKIYAGKPTKAERQKQYFFILILTSFLASLLIIAVSDLNADYISTVLTVPRTVKQAGKEIQAIDVSKATIREITAYNLGDKTQNDNSPCIMASGLNGCKLLEKGINICAANFVPLYTKLYIDKFGQCEVLDRLNSRYVNRIDIGMKLDEKERALKFGLQKLAVIKL